MKPALLDIVFNSASPDNTSYGEDLYIPESFESFDEIGSIRQANRNVIDKIGGLLPDTGPSGLLKGLYQGTDDALFGLLPSGKYKSASPETKLGKQISYIADPYVALRGVKYAVSGGTPISRLIANSVYPKFYGNKLNSIKRTLTNRKRFKEAVIDDIPQYKLDPAFEDRLFAWRTKLGLGKPNPKYHKMDVDRIWNKFGTHMEDGKKYYHYKNPDDFFAGMRLDRFGDTHKLFGRYSHKVKSKMDQISPWDRPVKGSRKHDYYDNWDFALNQPLRKYERGEWPILLQRRLAEALLNPLEFKGSAKEVWKDGIKIIKRR